MLISLVAVILSFTVVISAETGEIPQGSQYNYKWCYYTPGDARMYFYPTQLTSSDIVSGTDTYLFIPRQTTKAYLNNYFGDYVQLDFYFSIGAATSIPSAVNNDGGPFKNLQFSNQWISNSTGNNGPYISYFSNASYITSNFQHSGTTYQYSFLFNKDRITSSIFTVNGVSKICFLYSVDPRVISALSSTNVLMFTNVRVVATDELDIDQSTLLEIQHISEQIDAGVLSLTQGQTAIQNKIQAASDLAHSDALQAHQDAQALDSSIGDAADQIGGAVDSAAAQAHDDAERAHEDQEALQTLINGDGSYGSPESEYIQGFDDYEAAESEILDQVGVDSYLSEDYVDQMFNDLDFDNIDVPDRTSAEIFHLTVNPIFQYFPVFIVFPCFLGLVATILGRRRS